MTICIAAACTDMVEGKRVQYLVLCSDSRLSSALGSADAYSKHRSLTLSGKWVALTAGEEPSIVSLYKTYIPLFRDETNLQFDTLDRTMKQGAANRKSELCDELIQRKFGMSYSDFLAIGRDQFPPDLYYGTMKEVENLDLGAEFILAGFMGDYTEIYVCEQSAKVYAIEHFACVGEGSYLATSVLLRRSQNLGMELRRTLYDVYEAKRAAEHIGSVSKFTQMRIMTADGKCEWASPHLLKQLSDWYDTYGPKDVPPTLKYGGELFEQAKA